MDTLTQITLGAAVGEVCLGRKIGNKAAVWGAVFGVVPDLDVFAGPFVTEVQELVIHRGISHSLFFSVIAAPLFGWLLYRWYINKRESVSWRSWSLMVFLALITHIFIDACTSYGTQVFQPFNNYSLSFNTIFIIDPFYSVPLAAGILTALFLRRESDTRRWANYLGLGISSFYMLSGFAIKTHVNSVFEQNFEEQQISVDRYMTTPMPFTEFLWVVYAQSGDTIHAGLYSVFDNDREVEFKEVPMNTSLMEPYKDDLPVERVLWFSHGYFAAEQEHGGLYVHDLRFGRTDLWLTDDPVPYVWNFKLQFNEDSSRVTSFNQQEPSFNFSGSLFGKLTDRILGNE